MCVCKNAQQRKHQVEGKNPEWQPWPFLVFVPKTFEHVEPGVWVGHVYKARDAHRPSRVAWCISRSQPSNIEGRQPGLRMVLVADTSILDLGMNFSWTLQMSQASHVSRRNIKRSSALDFDRFRPHVTWYRRLPVQSLLVWLTQSSWSDYGRASIMWLELIDWSQRRWTLVSKAVDY